MGKELVTQEQAIMQIDNIINECLPITNSQTQGFREALVLAKGISSMRELFIRNEDIKKTVMSMKDTPLGFMTDRSPSILAAKRDLKDYPYEVIAESCIEAMLNGYRITNNEFNIIASRFYAAKNGKHRKIVETEGLTDFQFSHTPPLFETETRINYGKPETVSIAKVQCYASWKMHGQQCFLGKTGGDSPEDRCVFKIKVNAYMGDDGVAGKALSKLFTRVLQRITGKILPESTDIDGSDIIEGEVIKPEKQEDIRSAIKGKKQEEKKTEKAEPAMSNAAFDEIARMQKLNTEIYLRATTQFGRDPQTDEEVNQICVVFDDIMDSKAQ